MTKETDVRFSYSSIANPWRAISWGNEKYIGWAKEAGYSSAEYMPFVESARQIVSGDIDVIGDMDFVKSGHVHFNPYATRWSVLTRKEDPLRPGNKLAFYNLAFASPEVSSLSLKVLAQKNDDFFVVTYPYVKGGEHSYGVYDRQMVQTHPAVFNDTSSAEDLVNQVKNGRWAGVVWDTLHAAESTESGIRPLGMAEESLKILLDADVLREVHVQASRVSEKYGEIDDVNWLKDITGENPKYNNYLGSLIKIVKESGRDVPYVVEINLGGLQKAGILGGLPIIGPDLNKVAEVHEEIIDYIKRV